MDIFDYAAKAASLEAELAEVRKQLTEARKMPHSTGRLLSATRLLIESGTLQNIERTQDAIAAVERHYGEQS